MVEPVIEEEIKEEDSEILIDASGIRYLFIIIEYDIFSDNDDKKNCKKRKNKSTSRKLWTQSVKFLNL